MRIPFSTFVFFILASAASAQTLVGKALVEGKEVELFSDKTWRFTVEQAADCKTLTPKLQFCGDAARWKSSPPPSPVVAAAYSLNSSTYGQYVIEDLGTAQGMTIEAAKQAVVQIGENSTGETATILGNETTEFDGQPAETLIYQLKVSGMQIVFANTFVLRENTLAQIITYEITSGYSDAHIKAHAEFLAATRVTE